MESRHAKLIDRLSADNKRLRADLAEAIAIKMGFIAQLGDLVAEKTALQQQLASKVAVGVIESSAASSAEPKTGSEYWQQQYSILVGQYDSLKAKYQIAAAEVDTVLLQSRKIEELQETIARLKRCIADKDKLLASEQTAFKLAEEETVTALASMRAKLAAAEAVKDTSSSARQAAEIENKRLAKELAEVKNRLQETLSELAGVRRRVSELERALAAVSGPSKVEKTSKATTSPTEAAATAVKPNSNAALKQLVAELQEQLATARMEVADLRQANTALQEDKESWSGAMKAIREVQALAAGSLYSTPLWDSNITESNPALAALREGSEPRV